MMHPSTELRYVNDIVGFGVFAREFIPRGTVTWTRCLLDRVLTREEIDAMPPAYHSIIDRYAYNSPLGEIVLCWDIARFINHSCTPATMCVYDEVDIAIRDVQAGEELSYEYGSLNLDEELHCACGAPACRGIIRRDDVFTHGKTWDALILGAVQAASSVPQPLMPFIQDPARFQAVVSGREMPPPQQALYWAPGT